MQTRNGDLVITDQVPSNRHARHLGATTVKGVLRQQLGSQGESPRGLQQEMWDLDIDQQEEDKKQR
jgi:hypothetical protein